MQNIIFKFTSIVNLLIWIHFKGGAVLNKVIVITTVITYTKLSNRFFFFFQSLLLQIHYFFFTLFYQLMDYLVGQNYNCKVATLPFGGAFRGFNQYCICNYYGGVWLLLIVTTTFIRNTKRSVRDLFSSRTTCLRCHLYCICDSYASLFFYLLLFPMCL